MLDFLNIALRTVMCLAFIALVVRPLLMSMVRKDPNTLELEEMAQLAVSSAFKQQFATFYAAKPKPALEAPATPVSSVEEVVADQVITDSPAALLTEEELQALEEDRAHQAWLIKGHEEEMARRAQEAALEAERQARLEEEKARALEAGEDDEDDEQSLEKMRQNMKKEKKKPVIPAELLEGNSYEEKLMVVRYVAEQEKNRVAHAIRAMIKPN